MRKPKINDRKLIELIDKRGFTQTAAAKELGVSRQAVSQRIQELRGKTTKAVVAKKVSDVVDRKLDAIDQLQKINNHANELLDLCMAWGRGDDEALRILESQCTTRKVIVGNEEIDVQEFKFKDPRELALKSMAEIRGQLKLQLEIFQSLYDMRAVAEFQQEVLDVIGEADDETRRKIINRLNEKRAIRQVIRFH